MEPLFGPAPGERVILMDLNVALSSNFDQMRRHNFVYFITQVESFRQHVVDLLRDEYVIIVTARDARWTRPTLKRIYKTTGWSPQEAVFNDTGISGAEAHRVKERLLLDRILPEHPEIDAGAYLAIESNFRTREMYARHGIRAVDCDRHNRWVALPV